VTLVEGSALDVLQRIASHKRRREVPLQRAACPMEEIRKKAKAQPPALDFVERLRKVEGVALIAEMKRRSPSMGTLAPGIDPAQLAESYRQGGAAAISVVTDRRFFGGSMGDLERVKRAMAEWPEPLPLLRKDFIVDPYQVHAARAAGADAVLLIVAILSDAELRELSVLTQGLGMAPLVEAHSERELERALSAKPRMVGVNNRDLRDFTVDLETSLALRPMVPVEIAFIAESGIRTRRDVQRLAEANVDGMLVGEALVAAADPAAKARELTGWPG